MLNRGAEFLLQSHQAEDIRPLALTGAVAEQTRHERGNDQARPGQASQLPCPRPPVPPT